MRIMQRKGYSHGSAALTIHSESMTKLSTNFCFFNFSISSIFEHHTTGSCACCRLRTYTLSHCLFSPPDPEKPTVALRTHSFLQIRQPFHCLYLSLLSGQITFHPCHVSAPRKVAGKVRLVAMKNFAFSSAVAQWCPTHRNAAFPWVFQEHIPVMCRILVCRARR